MRIVTITLLAVLPLLGGCIDSPVNMPIASEWHMPIPACDCSYLSDLERPVGYYDITEAWKAGLEEGEAAVTDEAVIFRYTDDEGNQWEVEYAIIDEVSI